MKILRISLQNIASLAGRHTVDFTREPLRTAGLYAICGPTGSGKSTLLDALCLALYERTPRLNSVRGAVLLSEGITQKDPANLLRRGTAEGFAEVAFVGVDGETYTARWSVRRARGQVDGKLQSTEMALLRGDVRSGQEGQVLQGGKKSEVLPAIAARIGLSYEQFTRAVLLAQNDFAAFLKADDKERAEILQALTGTDRFERISRAVFQRCSDEQAALTAIKARIQGSEPLDAEARAAAEQAFANTEAELKAATGAHAARAADATWYKLLAELSEKSASAGKQLEAAATARTQAAPRRTELEHTLKASTEAGTLCQTEANTARELATAKADLESREKAVTAAQADLDRKKAEHQPGKTAVEVAERNLKAAEPSLKNARALDARLVPLTEQLEAAKARLETAQANLGEATARKKELGDELAAAQVRVSKLQAERVPLAAVAPFTPDSEAWIERLKRAEHDQAALQKADTQRNLLQVAEANAAKALEAERPKETEARAKVQTAATNLKQAEADVRAQDREQIATKRRETEAARDALRKFQADLNQLEELLPQARSAEAGIDALRSTQARDADSLQALVSRIPAAEQALKAAGEAVEIAAAAVADAAIALREKLAPDHPCPVCGSLEHPFATHPPSEDAVALRALRDARDMRQKELERLREEKARLEATLKERETGLPAKLDALEKLNSRIAGLRAVRYDHPAALAILELPETERSAAIAARLGAEEECLRALEKADRERLEAETRRERCLKAEREASEELAAVEKRISKLGGEWETTRQRRADGEQTVRAARASLDKSLAEVTQLLAAFPASDWAGAPAAFRERFSKDVGTLRELDTQLSKLDATLVSLRARVEPLDQALERARTEQAAKQSEFEKARRDHDALRTQRSELFGGRSADEVEVELREALGVAQKSLDRLGNELADLEKRLAVSLQGRAQAIERQGNAANQHRLATEALDQWLNAFSSQTGRPLDRTGLAAILARGHSWIADERKALETLEAAVHTASGALKECGKTLEDHLAKRPTTDEESVVRADLQALQTKLEACEAARNQARLALLADDQRRAKCAELAAELDLKKAAAVPWEKLNELIGSADGAKFRSIAQRRTLDILLGYANAQLEQLAARYRLERISESLNLLVIDREMGDERRSVHSLSGGECFLVSLALALALASLTSNRLRIESLFIDEGFGSLDPDTLNVAMGALMHLEAQGRKVGVISHVAEMAEAIPVRIRVVKGRSGASRVLVPGAQPELPEEPEPAAAKTSDEPVAEVAERILSILSRQKESGEAKVSARALREEIGCSTDVFNQARNSIGDQVQTEGRSLRLI